MNLVEGMHSFDNKGRKGLKKRWGTYKTKKSMADLNEMIPIITLNVNGLNT